MERGGHRKKGLTQVKEGVKKNAQRKSARLARY